VIREVMKDKPFYRLSGGGVTFSGGEPLFQPDFLLELLKECKKLGVNTAMETSGCGRFEVLWEAADYLDTIYYDLKCMDTEKHRELTGVSNVQINENLRQLAAAHGNVIVRIPVVPGCNDDAANIESIARFCLTLESVAGIELLPYHRLGEHKFSSMGREYVLKGLKEPDEQQMNDLAERINRITAKKGIVCSVVHA